MKNKYKKIKLKDGSTIDEHRLVWISHHGEIPKDHVVHHINGDKLDNRIENLELMTKSNHAKFHWVGFDHIPDYPDDMSWCCKCHTMLPKCSFGLCSSRWNGLSYECKECKRARQRKSSGCIRTSRGWGS